MQSIRQPQAAILAPLPDAARYAFAQLSAGCSAKNLRDALLHITKLYNQYGGVLGFSIRVYQQAEIAAPPLLKAATAYALPPMITNLQRDSADLCWWLPQNVTLPNLPLPFGWTKSVDAFTYQRGTNGLGHDLSGYEDGSENPPVAEAPAITFTPEQGSYWVLQQWQHNFAALNAMSLAQQNAMMGRDKVSNQELEDALPSAHIKRTEQESFTPEAFLWRRSMPWAQQLPWQNAPAGLMFSAFARDFYAFEVQWQRMLGLVDGITDAVFDMSLPLTHDYFYCPPSHNHQLVLVV